jgi:penicillin amidase
MARSALARTVRWINVAIALALLAAGFAAWWFAWRPLPRVSGSIAAPVSREVAVARDGLGVPHIRAANVEDALFAQGYASAQDRLWQMDALRRLASGELAEVLGPPALAMDREARRLRMRRIAEDAAVSLAPEDRAAFAAYTRGVNEFIRTHLDRLPLEFTLLGYGPRPWSVVDCVLVSLQMCRALTASWKTDYAKGSLMSAGNPAKVALLFPPRSGSEVQVGSNAWAVSGARTASGKPILANDPHLEYSLPGIWYMVHLQAPGLDVSGVSLPGIPGVIIGHNDRIAWGVTNLGFDVQDLYIERFDDRTGRYLFRGELQQARREREIIRIKGRPPEELTVWVTRHGPLFLSEGNLRLALRWAAAEPGGFRFPILDLDRARNWQEFTAALARFPGPSQNFVYADADGNIGYHAAGRLPVRKTFLGDVPVDGASGDYEWDGWIPFEQLPAAFNPPGGIIATANQDPFPANYPYKVNGIFASPYRARQIRDLLASRKGWRAADMLAVQKDVYSGFSRYLARAAVAAWDRRKAANPELRDAIALLRAWNGQMDQDQSAPLVVALLYQHLRRAVGESAAGRTGAVWGNQMAPAVLEALLRAQPSGWFPDWDTQLLRSLQDAVNEGRRMQGRDVNKWWYGKYLKLAIRNPVFDQLPLLAKYLRIGPVPASGSGTTVKQTTFRMGPSMRMSADLADWDRSLMNIVTGQSGHPLSRHYKDQWSHYYSAESYPMQFRNVKPESVLRLAPQ